MGNLIFTNLVEANFGHRIMNNATAAGNTALANALKAALDEFKINNVDWHPQTVDQLNISHDFVGVLGDTVGYTPLD